MAEPTSDAVSLAEIEAALAEVQAQRAKYEALMATLRDREVWLLTTAEAMREFIKFRSSSRMAGADERSVTVVQVKSTRPDGPTMLEYAGEALAKRGELMDTWPLIEAMQENGYTTTAKDVYLTVYGSLNRAAKKPDSHIVKVGTKWGLREWYPDGVSDGMHVLDFSRLVKEVADEEEEQSDPFD